MAVTINNLATRQLKVILYKLRRQFASTVIVQEQLKDSRNYQTGVLTQTHKKFHMYNQIALPEKVGQKFVYDLAYIAANKNFTQGGFFDKGDRIFILELDDLPFELTTDHTIKFEDKEYSIRAIERLETTRSALVRSVNVSNQND